jgi:hypothetical protein
LPQSPHLRKSDCLKRMTESQSAAHFTSQKTSVRPASPTSAATMSISPSRQRQFRSSTCMPCRPNSAQAKSFPRAPICCLAPVLGIAPPPPGSMRTPTPNRARSPKSVETHRPP